MKIQNVGTFLHQRRVGGLERKDRLPDPRGSLSFAVPKQAVAEAISEVHSARSSNQKRRPYHSYSAKVRISLLQLLPIYRLRMASR